MSQASDELREGWTLILASGVGFALGMSGLPFYTISVFLDPLHKAFGWSVASVQSAILMISILGLVTTPIVGWLSDKMGTRRLAITSTVLFSLAFMSLGLSNGNYATFLLAWFCIGVGGAGTLSIVWSRAISTWFCEARGLALGMTLLGTGLTGFLAPPLAAWMIVRWNWRTAYTVLGAAPLCISLPLLILFFKERTEFFSPVVTVRGATVGEALSDRRFWLIAICLLFVSTSVAGVITNLVKLLTGQGFSVRDATWTASLVGLSVLVGRLSCGFLLDRVWAPLVGLCFFIGMPFACLILSQQHVTPTFARLGAVLVGLGAAAEFDVIPYLICRYFGLRRLGSVLGFVTLFFCIGSSAGPVAFGRVFDLFGTYRPVLWIAAALSLTGPVLLLFLGPYLHSASNTERSESCRDYQGDFL